MEITWKLRLKYFYIFAKAHALAHFNYEEKKNEVYLSSTSVAYGCVWAVGYFLTFIWLLIALSVLLNDTNGEGKMIFHIVNGIELTTITLKAFSLYFLRIIQSRDLVRLINDAIGVNEAINRETVKFQGQHFVMLYNFKMLCLLLQTVLLFAAYFIYVAQSISSTAEKVVSFFIVYIHFSTTVVSGCCVYGSLLFGYDFYYKLNRKLVKILNKIEIKTKSKIQAEIFCYACDELDKISLLYTRISSYVALVNQLFAVQITFELLGSFLMITCSVC